ncbi:hypothetical protein [Spongiimicrobium sp. 3-5]|uniref:hypothetical protein n=1 Tax=Spongiimicrobium sp. 3-5 TaxID=3332596 RepID=UPI00397F1ECD
MGDFFDWLDGFTDIELLYVQCAILFLGIIAMILMWIRDRKWENKTFKKYKEPKKEEDAPKMDKKTIYDRAG